MNPKKEFDIFFQNICPSKEERFKHYECLGLLLKVLEEHNISYFPCFGTMLGCIRNRGFVPWDDDIDLMIEESDAEKLNNLTDELNSFGIKIDGNEHSYSIETPLHTDIFIGKRFSHGNKIAIMPKVSVEHEPNAQWFAYLNEVYPLKKYDFGPLSIWGMNDPHSYLARFGYTLDKGIICVHKFMPYCNRGVIEGPFSETLDFFASHGLHPVTDPKYLHFNYDFEPFDINLDNYRLKKMTNDYWNIHYQSTSMRNEEPSSFAQFVLDHYLQDPTGSLIDFGCGQGRDSRFFAQKDIAVLGTDASITAIFHNKTNNDFPNLHFKKFAIGEDVFDDLPKATYYYARFLLHALTEDQENMFLDYMANQERGSWLFLEFRTDKDPLRHKFLNKELEPDHYRRFINFSTLEEKLDSKGIKILYTHESDDLSIYNDDNPVLGRIVAIKQ